MRKTTRIWTQVAVSISYNDNHYTTSASYFKCMFMVEFILNLSSDLQVRWKVLSSIQKIWDFFLKFSSEIITFSLSCSDILTPKNFYTQNMSLHFKLSITAISIKKISMLWLTLFLLTQKRVCTFVFQQTFPSIQRNKNNKLVDQIFY